MNRTTTCLAVSAGLVITTLFAGPGVRAHEGHRVFLNGVPLTDYQVHTIEVTYNTYVADGYYLYDGARIWRADENAAGHGDGYYHRNQGGYLGSDGRCSYIYIPESGTVMSGGCE